MLAWASMSQSTPCHSMSLAGRIHAAMRNEIQNHYDRPNLMRFLRMNGVAYKRGESIESLRAKALAVIDGVEGA